MNLIKQKLLPTIYIARSNNIVFNLSTEEYFYEHENVEKPILFLYQNDKNVVIGKHQNPWKECHITLMEQDKINLARRRSGGGAVYQDLGNLVFSFLLPHDPSIDFKEINTNILINAFKKLGINAYFSGRNDILVDERKISGSAFKINMGNKKFNAKSLHHGTIMLNVDLANMQKYLNPNKLKLISKGVDSVKSRVLNLNDRFPNINKEIVFEALEKEFLSYHNITEYEKINLDDENSTSNNKINDLYKHYNSWDWKFGTCPDFTDSLYHKFDWGLIDLSLKVENGIIIESKVYSDSLHMELIDLINNNLTNLGGKFRYDIDGISKLIDSNTCDNQMYNKFLNEMKNVLINQIL